MKAIAESVAFGSIAVVLHVAILSDLPTGTEGQTGAGGTASITLSAASAQASAVIQAWERAPVAPGATPAAFAPPGAAQEAPPLPLTLPAPDRPAEAAPAGLAALPDSRAAPQVDTTPAPARAQAPNESPRPPVRPDRLAAPPERNREPPRSAAPAPAAPPTTQASPSPPSVGSDGSSPRSARAAGTGGGATAGGGAVQEAAQSPARRSNLMSRWGSGIAASVERRLRAPRGAIGTVRLQLSVATNGRLAAVRLVSSSGNAALDRAALTAVRSGRLPSAPRGLAAQTYTFTLPIRGR